MDDADFRKALAKYSRLKPPNITVDQKAPATLDPIEAVARVQEQTELTLFMPLALTEAGWAELPSFCNLRKELEGKVVLALGGIWIDEWSFPSSGYFDRTGQLWADSRSHELSKGLAA